MRIGYLIGALGSGGSERQLSELAVGMVGRGHQVEVACYDGEGAFDSRVERGGGVVRRMAGGSRLDKLRNVRAWIEQFDPDVLHGFMKRASSLAVLANLPKRRRVVASDLSTATYSRRKPALWGALILFGLANRVATQTETNRRSLETLAPWLRGKVDVVRNGVDTNRFRPAEQNSEPRPFRFVCVGSVYRVKNPVRVVEAVSLLRDRVESPFTLDWYGRLGLGGGGAVSEDYREARERVEKNSLGDVVTFRGETERIESAYQSADAVVHVSLQEGIPNAVVEAMACGLPVVVSRVSDLPLLVSTADNGFVCDERSVESIAEAMERMLTVGSDERAAMSQRSRQLAVEWFGADRFIEEYESMYRELVLGS